MNLPNKLTLLRIAMIPLFLIFAAPVPVVPDGFFMLSVWSNFIETRGLAISGIVFIIAFATDALDGYIARKYNLITDFGKFLDPIADKLLVTAALLALLARGRLGVWIPVIIISREFIITGLRLMAARDGIVLAADKLGKLKPVIQTADWIFALFENFTLSFLNDIMWDRLLMIAALVLTIVSGIGYIIRNKGVLSSAAM
jgi:CDP-diacylglycerol--glycerol-3-phosphate 3-phosphatidyltransferase